MEIKLNLEQISYLKSLDSKKKKRKFLLDCLIENVEISESADWFKNLIIGKHIKLESISESDKLATQKEIKSKSNYSPEEIELAKHNINQREISEQGSELLKFDMLEDEFWQTQKENEKLKKKINKQNIILDQFDTQEDKSLENLFFENYSKLTLELILLDKDISNILKNFLISINTYYHYKTSKTIDFIDELFPHLKNNEIAK